MATFNTYDGSSSSSPERKHYTKPREYPENVDSAHVENFSDDSHHHVRVLGFLSSYC